MRHGQFIAVGMLLSAAFLSADTGAVLPGQALISGIAVDADAIPIAGAPVRLRNLDSRQLEQTKIANAVGEFSFSVRPGIPYVVEIADPSGRILAVGDVVIAQGGDVVGTMVAINAKVPSAAGLFTDSLGSVISAAAGMGVTAVETTVLPFVSPER